MNFKSVAGFQHEDLTTFEKLILQSQQLYDNELMAFCAVLGSILLDIREMLCKYSLIKTQKSNYSYSVIT